MKTRKKRSLRGKIFLALAYLIALCILICTMKLISTLFIPEDKRERNKEVKSSNNQMDHIKYDEGIKGKVPGADTEPRSNGNQDNYVEENIVEKVTAEVLTKAIIDITLKIPYEENARCRLDGKSIEIDTIDGFGLVDYVYTIMKGKHLSEVGIDELTLASCKEIKMNDLQVGDVGVCKIDDSIIYGIYVGNDKKHPLFAYACDLSNGTYESGSIYISYNKKDSNNLFLGMYPMPYEKYYRLPSVGFIPAAAQSIPDLLAPELVPSEKYMNNASAVYRIGEWINEKNHVKLMERINTSALNDAGYTIDDNIYSSYIEGYNETVGTDNFILRISNFEKFENYSTVLAEVVMISDTDRTFTDSGINFECTVYEDGSYLPGSVLTLSKNAIMYGYVKKPREIQKEDDSNTSEAHNEVVETEQTIQGPGFSIDVGDICPE